MIEKNEVLRVAKNLNLRPDTVEKDYVLGWMLHGIFEHPVTKNWAFKGGTSLKKCFFETFRFSEDLDFTVKDNSYLDKDLLLEVFYSIAESLVPEVKQRFKSEFTKPRFTIKKEMLAPPVTNNPILVGIAFDYLLRFYIQCLNPKAITRDWIAHHTKTFKVKCEVNILAK